MNLINSATMPYFATMQKRGCHYSQKDNVIESKWYWEFEKLGIDRKYHLTSHSMGYIDAYIPSDGALRRCIEIFDEYMLPHNITIQLYRNIPPTFILDRGITDFVLVELPSEVLVIYASSEDMVIVKKAVAIELLSRDA